MYPHESSICLVAVASAASSDRGAGDEPATRIYENRLKPIANPRPILGDYPNFVEPVRELARFEAPILIDDPDADLEVRAWRFSYNARGIIEVPNRLRVKPDGRHRGASLGHRRRPGLAHARARRSCVSMHPGQEQDRARSRRQGYQSVPQDHASQSRPARGLQSSGNGGPDSPEDLPFAAQTAQQSERQEGERELKAKLASFDYQGQPVPARSR